MPVNTVRFYCNIMGASVRSLAEKLWVCLELRCCNSRKDFIDNEILGDTKAMEDV